MPRHPSARLLVVQLNKKSGSADVISRAAHSLFSFLLSAPQSACPPGAEHEGPREGNLREVKRPKLAAHSAQEVHTGDHTEAVCTASCRAGKQTSVQVWHKSSDSPDIRKKKNNAQHEVA